MIGTAQCLSRRPAALVQEKLIISYDKTGLDLKFERAFVLVVENALSLSAVALYNRNTITNFHVYSHQCQDGRAV